VIVKYARTRPRKQEVGKYPNAQTIMFFEQCYHCDNAPCVKVCPTGASYKAEDGAVLVDADKCIKCKYCISACPYGARKFPTEVEEFQGETLADQKYALKPTIPDKCTFCYHRKSGNEPWTPACVENCPTGSRIFGDLDDPNSEISKAVSELNAVQYHPEFGTKPNVYYVVPTGKLEALPEKEADLTPVELHEGVETIKKLAVYGAAATAAVVVANAVKEKVKGKEEGGE